MFGYPLRWSTNVNNQMDASKDSPEKLLEKYKEKYSAALGIAQKAKNARDEAIRHNKMILAENESLREKVKQLEKQYSTVEEMLAALTEQKLKLSMEIDDLKKKSVVFIKEYETKAENAEIEAESYKRQYDRLLKENEDIINKFSLYEQECVSLRKEFDEVKKINNSLKQLYGNVQSEKEDLAKSFKDTLQRLCDLEENQKLLNSALSQKFKIVVNDVKEWIQIISSEKESWDTSNHEQTLNDMAHREKENLEQEISDLNEVLSTLRQELNVANTDRDKMMNNLEKVGLETKQLIENSEKLTDEIAVLKEEKNRLDSVIGSLEAEKALFSKIIKDNEDEISRLCLELREKQQLNEQLLIKIESMGNAPCFESNNSIIEEKSSNIGNSKDLRGIADSGLDMCSYRSDSISGVKNSVKTELNELQEELQTFSHEIGKYKLIADEFKAKFENALKELDEKKLVIIEHENQIENLKIKIAGYEEQQSCLSSSLSECKAQLLEALKDLSSAEEIKNNLMNESEIVNTKLTKALKNLFEKENIIYEQSNKIKNLEETLETRNSNLEASNKLLDEYKEDANFKQCELSKLIDQTNELKISIENITEESKCKLLKYQNEINDLKKIIEEFQQQNTKLSSVNNDLQSKLEDKQFNSTTLEEDYSLMKSEMSNLIANNSSIISLNEKLKSKLKEKDNAINLLENEIATLKSELSNLKQQNNILCTDHDNLKLQLKDKECIIVSLEEKNLSLESKFSNLMGKNENINGLFEELSLKVNEKQDSINSLEQEMVVLKSDLSNLIQQNKDLTSINDSLQTQLKEKEAFILQIEEDNLSSKMELSNIVKENEKLNNMYDEMQLKIKEKDIIESSLEKEISTLKGQMANVYHEKDEILSQNSILNAKIESLHNSNSEEFINLSKENKELQEQLKTLSKQAIERDEHLTNLKSDLENLVKVRDYIEKGRELLSQEKSHLDELLNNAISSFFELNNKMEFDILRLKGDNSFSAEPHKLEKNDVNLIIKYSGILKQNQQILSEEVTSMLRVNEMLLKENTSIKEKIESLETECLKLRDNLAELQSTNIAHENITTTIKELEDEKSNLLEKIHELSSSNNSLNEKLNVVEIKLIEILKKSNELGSHKERKSEVLALQDLLPRLEEKVSQLTKVENKFSDLKSSFDDLNEKYFVLNEENLSLKKQNNEYYNTITSMQEQWNDMQAKSLEGESVFKIEMEKKSQEILDYIEKLKLAEQKVSELSKANDSLIAEYSELSKNIENLHSTYTDEKQVIVERSRKLQEELDKCNELLSFKSLELQKNNRIWAGRLSSLKMALIGLNKSRKEIQNQFERCESLFLSFMDQLKDPLQDKINLVVQHSVSAAKIELIHEMQQMNQAIKERGETISKLEFEISEYQTRLKHLSSLNENTTVELLQTRDDLKIHQERMKEKEIIIKQLENENEQLKEGHTADSEVLSTSTISRSEECARMRDVEESLEDRYAKLKLLAVKMKKRIGDLTHTLETERSKISTERLELQEKITSMSSAVKNAQKLQELFDQSLDERDELKNKNKLLENSLEELKNSEETLKAKVAALELNNQNIPIMKKHIDSLNGIVKDSKAEIQKLQMENKAETIKYEELKKNCSKLEAKVQELTRSLEQAKQQGKNSNVLELEMKNYEKIVTDLSSQLNTEKIAGKNLQKELEAVQNMKTGLNEQIEILEKQIKVEEERNRNTNEQLNISRIKLEESAAEVESLKNETVELQKQLASEKSKKEALVLEMSQITSEFSSKEMSMISKISTLQEQTRSLETSLQSTKQELLTSKKALEQLNEEYEGYKLRAQTILAKRKGEFVTHGEKEAREEVEQLKKDCKLLEEKLEAYTSEIETLNTRISSLILEKTRNDKKIDQMKQALQQKRADYDLLNTEFYNFKISNEAVIENLKDELARKKYEYQSELNNQRKIIDELSSEFKYKEDSVETPFIQRKEQIEYSSMAPVFQEEGPLISEREDGEGSESVPSPITRRHSSNLIPLDILLNNPILDENKVFVLQEQVEKLQKELSTYDVRCKHLSSLLSEAERDSARNIHQNKILKEELRRLERSLERQPHVANTEYLKNVLFKFVTLPVGDERSRLVPVLDTLLKLSPEESNKLNSVARGESQAGWSSYLQSWTGL